MLKSSNSDNYGTVPIATATSAAASSECTNVQNDDDSDYIAYPQRWLVLAAFSILSLMNNWLWITWSPLAKELAVYWEVTTPQVDNLSAVYMYVYIPLSFPALIALHKYKLRWGLLVGGSLNFAGAVIRYFGIKSYGWVYLGTFLCACCQTLTLAMPPLISTLWFRQQERGLATSLGVLANQLGAAFGLGITILVHFSSNNEKVSFTLDESTLQCYLQVQMVLSALTLLLIANGVQLDAPPTPPSEAASYQKHTTYLESIRLLLASPSGSILCLVYGLTVGVLYALATFLSQFFLNGNSSGGWSEREAGYLGVLLIILGLPGSLLAGEWLDKQSQHPDSYRRISITLLVASCLSMFGFLLFLEFQPSSRWLACLAISCLGFFLTGFITVGFEYGTAISYPADEAAVAGVMNVAAQIGGWALVVLGGRVGVGESLNMILVFTLVVALALMALFVRATSVRPSGLLEARI